MNAKIYTEFCKTAFAHGLSAIARRRRTHLVALLIISPALIPLLLLVIPHDHEEGFVVADVFSQMTEMMYIMSVTPLLALFFGAMLLGEDIESQTIPYLITRPIPRSAWIIGRFAAYLVSTSVLTLAGILATFIACSALQPSFVSVASLGLMLHYQVVAIASLLGYGALCMMLGSIVRRPAIVGVLFIFGWQRGAMLAPGLTDFLTIEKHVIALLPANATIIKLVGSTPLETYKSDYAVSAPAAAATLMLIAAVCLALTTLAVMNREYTTPTAVSE